jgi:hypothetical protein
VQSTGWARSAAILSLQPNTWPSPLQVSDIGADAVFEDPDQRSTRVGVTVYNVSISSLEEFGDVDSVGQQLLDAGVGKGPWGWFDSGLSLFLGSG